MRNELFDNKAAVIMDHAAGHTSAGSQGGHLGLTGFPSLGVFDMIFGLFFSLDQTPTFGSVHLPDFLPFIDRGAGGARLTLNGYGDIRNVQAYSIAGKRALISTFRTRKPF